MSAETTLPAVAVTATLEGIVAYASLYQHGEMSAEDFAEKVCDRIADLNTRWPALLKDTP